jgi:hypothetical protein
VRRVLLSVGAAVVVAVLAAACSDDQQTGTSDTTADAPVEEPSTTAPDGDDEPSTTAPDGEDDPAGPDATAGPDAAAEGDPGAALPAGYEGYVSDQYAGGRHWLCHPDDADENVCDRDLTATTVAADLSTAVEEHAAAPEPAIDCFYVYPTISNDPGLNADLDPADGEEIRALVNQAARLSSVCEVYAPVYRQLTIGSLLRRMSGEEIDEAEGEAAYETAYGDVLDAWKHYVANHNQGRGVLLIGHSQGAGMLTRLVAEEIDGVAALQERLVAAYLLGTDLAVPEGEDVGGAFDEIPLCRDADQTGCVVAYASFPASLPPGEDSLFGKVDDPDAAPGTVSACTNPGALSGGPAPLVPYFTAEESTQALQDLPAVDTPWVSLRDSLTGECVVRDGHHVLEVTVNGDPTDTRDRNLSGGLPANWGLHLADVNLAMGNLVALAERQAAAHAG